MPKPASRQTAPQTPSAPQVVDPRWLFRTLSLLVVAALVCGYLTLGLLFYLGSWQLVLHPTHDAGKDTALSAEHVRFGDGTQGSVPAGGQWFPSGQGAAGNTGDTVLYLRDADGQLDAGDGTQIQSLQNAGLNVLAFDYRGYGRNPPQPHPSELRMLEDANTAWKYLVQTRRIAPNHILVFGSGVGVSLGTQLLEQHTDAAALIGYNADPDVLLRVHRDPRSKLFPVSVVFHDNFSLDGLQSVKQSKLLYSVGVLDANRRDVYRRAADPKLTVEVPTHDAKQEADALSRFLDTYLPRTPQLLPIPPA